MKCTIKKCRRVAFEKGLCKGHLFDKDLKKEVIKPKKCLRTDCKHYAMQDAVMCERCYLEETKQEEIKKKIHAFNAEQARLTQKCLEEEAELWQVTITGQEKESKKSYCRTGFVIAFVMGVLIGGIIMSHI